jgi:hypothetical protein
MAVTNTPIYPQALLSVPTQLTNATSTSTPTQILAAQTNGAKIEAILVASTDTSARDLNLYLTVSATNYFIGIVSIPITAGTVDTVPSVNMLTALTSSSALLPLPNDSNGNPYLYLDPNTTLKILPGSTITSGKDINLVVMGGAF